MKILKFIVQETDISRPRILLLAAISGIANGLLLVILNEAAANLEDGLLEAQLFFQYLITFVLFIYAQRTSQREAVIAVEQALQKVRVRLADKIRHCELRTIEQMDDISNYSPLTQGANTMAQSAMYLVTGVESLLVLIFASLYLLWLSPASFTVAMILIALTVLLLVRHYRRSFSELSQAAKQEGQFFAHFTSMLKGFKQLKTRRSESDELFGQLQHLATETSTLKSRANVRLLEDILLSNVTFYLLLLLVTFLLPTLVSAPEAHLFQVITTILFMMEPVSMISSAIPNISKTNVSVTSLYQLEARLDKITGDTGADDLSGNTISYQDFNTISWHDTTFTYRNDQQQGLFQTGPFSNHCQRGEILFITGGNGSGKSTFLKLLSGLYYPEHGSLAVDGQTLKHKDYPGYRELFSVVFNDFHLFDRLYGQTAAIDDEVNQWLEKMGLADVTRCENGRFSRTDLSTGQRKRLAFITTIIQHRPVLVLDELTADQDPAFRKHFYTVILPELQAAGKTIIMVTHDDRYFHLADRVLWMEGGHFTEQPV